MAIRVGGGYHLDGDDGGDARRRLPPGYPRMLPTSPGYKGFTNPPMFDPGRGHNLPLLPDGLRLGLFRVIDERDDYLICSGYDPDTRKSQENIAVAKPYLLQRTPFDGQTVSLRDIDVSYQYTDQVGLRLATATIEDQEVQEYQRITEDYYAGDVLTAVRARIRESDSTGALDEDGQPIEWIDLNVSARAWAVTYEDVEE